MTPTLIHESLSSVRPDSTGDSGPLSSNELNQLDEGNRNFAKLRRAASVAAVSGWSLVIFGALTLPFGWFDFQSFLVGGALGVIGWNELRGRRLLLQVDESGPRVLWQNQLTLMGVLILYSSMRIHDTLTAPNPYAAELDTMPELAGSLGPLTDLYASVAIGIYGAIIIFSVIFQGLHATYYFKQLKHLRQYRERTPAWVLEVQRMTNTTTTS